MLCVLGSDDGAPPLDADICIVGAGFAGYEIARVLGGAGRRVLIVDSGLQDFDAATQHLSATVQAGAPLRRSGDDFNSHLPEGQRGLSHARQLGGTSSIWSGKWKKLDPIDLSPRAWIDHSGWPIAWDALDELYGQVARDYSLTAPAPEAARIAPALAAAGLDLSPHYQEAQPLRLRDRFLELGRRADLVICLGATAVELTLDAERPARIRALTLRGRDGRDRTATAACFVLAGGGLENPRLLLASNRQVAAGLGNHSDAVGRFYMDHPKIEFRLAAGGRSARLPRAIHARKDAPAQIGLRLSDVAQAQARLPNHAVYLTEKARLFRPHRHRLRLFLEQLPNPDSRVRLDDARDAAGLPRLRVEWRLRDGEMADARRFVHATMAALLAYGVALETPPVDRLDSRDFATSNHHMGTTRMAARPEDGVVDPDCKVFGLDNLFVAGSSVFPTGSNANPTLTIVALARRLADHLAGRLWRESPAG